jgi:hypothetical protein
MRCCHDALQSTHPSTHLFHFSRTSSLQHPLAGSFSPGSLSRASISPVRLRFVPAASPLACSARLGSGPCASAPSSHRQRVQRESAAQRPNGTLECTHTQHVAKSRESRQSIAAHIVSSAAAGRRRSGTTASRSQRRRRRVRPVELARTRTTTGRLIAQTTDGWHQPGVTQSIRTGIRRSVAIAMVRPNDTTRPGQLQCSTTSNRQSIMTQLGLFDVH